MSSKPIILSDANYTEWAHLTKAQIISDGAPGCILGTYVDPGFQDSTDSVDAANFQLIDGKNSKEACEVLFATHNKQNSSQQFQLFQELACTSQNANESLTAYHQRIELAADRLYASFTSGMTAKDVVDSMPAYFLLLGLEKDEFNDILNSHCCTRLC
ncbi:hypothetical protein M407DRAFT_32901, partial [Tulasnella calospora MUT 4182]